MGRFVKGPLCKRERIAKCEFIKKKLNLLLVYWVPQKLPQIFTVILCICIERLRDLQHIFAVTYGAQSIMQFAIFLKMSLTVISLCSICRKTCLPHFFHSIRSINHYLNFAGVFCTLTFSGRGGGLYK